MRLKNRVVVLGTCQLRRNGIEMLKLRNILKTNWNISEKQ